MHMLERIVFYLNLLMKIGKWATMGLKMDAGSGSINRDEPHKDSPLKLATILRDRPLKRSASVNGFYETDSFDNLRESILRDGQFVTTSKNKVTTSKILW